MCGRVLFFLFLALVLGPPVLEPYFHLRFCEAEGLCELFPFRADYVVVLLEGVLQLEELRRGEGRPDPLWFPKRVQKEARGFRTSKAMR